MVGEESLYQQLYDAEMEVAPATEEHKEALVAAYMVVAAKIAADSEVADAVMRVMHWWLEVPLHELRNNTDLGERPWEFSEHQGAVKMFGVLLRNLTDQSEIANVVRSLGGEEAEE